MCVESEAQNTLLARLAERYWARVVYGRRYRRPEVMVTSDVDPAQIAVVTDA
jgi:hypothetical protein